MKVYGILPKVLWVNMVKEVLLKLNKWFKAGVTCVGMGSNLFPKEAIAAKDWSAVTRLCKDALAIISDVK